jgi:hypothetical protein
MLANKHPNYSMQEPCKSFPVMPAYRARDLIYPASKCLLQKFDVDVTDVYLL